MYKKTNGRNEIHLKTLEPRCALSSLCVCMPSSLTTNMKKNIEAKLHTHTRCIVCDADDEYKYTDNNTSEKRKTER